jgi:MFS transporter, OFA family, oxalate/formate antiporter
MQTQKLNPGWVVAFAGLGINLALGVLYAWGVIASELRTGLGWSATWTQIPYMVACAVFALSMVPGGRLQDRVGPRPVVLIAAVLAGIGFLMSGLVLRLPIPLIEYIGLIIFFGFVFGAGMGLGYSAPTPAAKKWFPKKQKGLITGIVVSGFGLAPVYIAPLTSWLIASFGLSSTFMILGIGFFIIILALSVFMRNPTEQHLAWLKENHPEKTGAAAEGQKEYDWKEALATKTFRRLWIMFCFGTFAGLLIIGQMRDIGTEQAHIASPFLLPIFYAIFNCTGRLVCGFFSDWLGRLRSLVLLFAIQVVTFIGFMFIQSSVPMIIGVCSSRFYLRWYALPVSGCHFRLLWHETLRCQLWHDAHGLGGGGCIRPASWWYCTRSYWYLYDQLSCICRIKSCRCCPIVNRKVTQYGSGILRPDGFPVPYGRKDC